MIDFNLRPFTVIWESTRACDLMCLHCRADALPHRSPSELTTEEVTRLVAMVKEFGRPYPIFILTGGDPMKRTDIFDVIAHATQEGLRVAMTPSATPLVTRDSIQKLARAGLVRLALSLDGSESAMHDHFRGVRGSFAWTLRILEWCREFGLETQIHTTVTKHSLNDLPRIADRIAEWGIKLWALFFLISVGRAVRPEVRRLNVGPHDFENIFNWIYELSKSAPYEITPREGHHYRRILLQRRAEESSTPVEEVIRETIEKSLRPADFLLPRERPRIVRAPLGVNDGRGVVFVSHVGGVQPSGFLPLEGGNIRKESLQEIYCRSPLFLRVRDFGQLKGKCGDCEFKPICGGSRARAYAVTGDPMRSDPYCIYRPRLRGARRTVSALARSGP